MSTQFFRDITIWLDSALSYSGDRTPNREDLHALREWIASGCVGDIPLPTLKFEETVEEDKITFTVSSRDEELRTIEILGLLFAYLEKDEIARILQYATDRWGS